MLRSLWSGMTGLSVHQTALDVEANNVANVNTNGFKYSRVSFEDLLSQNTSNAASPTATNGGTNSAQVGLGVKLAEIEKIFKQGSLQATDSVTDLALQGDGFFVVSNDGGQTQGFTRDGGFQFDANGTLVSSNGAKVQGWGADSDFVINTSNRVGNIVIDPKMVLKAHATENLTIAANLDSSSQINQTIPAQTSLQLDAKIANVYNQKGEPLNVLEGEHIVITLRDPLGGPNKVIDLTYPLQLTTMRDIINTINENIVDPMGETVNRVYVDGAGRFIDNGRFIQSIVATNPEFNGIFATFPVSTSSEPLKIGSTSPVVSDDVAELFNKDNTKIGLTSGQGVTFTAEGLYQDRKFIYKEITDGTTCLTSSGQLQDPADLENADINTGMHWTKDALGNAANFNNGDTITIDFQDPANPGVTTDSKTFTYGIDFHTIDELMCACNKELSNDLTQLVADPITGAITKNSNFINNITLASGPTSLRVMDAVVDNGIERLQVMFNNLASGTAPLSLFKNDKYYFNNTQDLQQITQIAIDDAGNLLNSTNPIKGNVSVDAEGKLSILNNGTKTYGIDVSGYPDSSTENKLFTGTMASLKALSVPGNTSSSSKMSAASHTISTDVYDEFGGKFALDLSFRKADSQNEDGKIVWLWNVDITTPVKISSIPSGEVVFNADGSLSSYTPTTVTFSPNSAPNGTSVTVSLDFGKEGQFAGLVSQTGPSATFGIQQDGYTRGLLEDIAIDGEGTIAAKFSNGKTKALGKIAVATFANNAGLTSQGGNIFQASGNSGEPMLATAGSPGVASVQSYAVERSNVDLSKALVEMIILQRGFQANSKTISTADQVLQTLLDLKR